MESFDRSFGYWSVAEGITAIETPGKSFGPGKVPGTGHVMAYLIEGEEKAVLWDNGYGNGNIRALVQKLTDLPVMAVNSHNHLDHNGCNPLFEEVWIGEHEDGLDKPAFPVDERIPGGVDKAVDVPVNVRGIADDTRDTLLVQYICPIMAVKRMAERTFIAVDPYYSAAERNNALSSASAYAGGRSGHDKHFVREIHCIISFQNDVS